MRLRLACKGIRLFGGPPDGAVAAPIVATQIVEVRDPFKRIGIDALASTPPPDIGAATVYGRHGDRPGMYLVVVIVVGDTQVIGIAKTRIAGKKICGFECDQVILFLSSGTR
ncbi:hypothetical protein [Falsirhodobacter sp. 1013]|uniref:hypothetical protein n=1 Tax=Falsirhodobacter sp. 1013 TaxID=3417566 RepID=UPI003EB96905